MTQLGKYELLETLGSGAYATVYRARDTQLGRVVALKVLHPAHMLDQIAIERFRREGQALANLVHPHIAFAWEFGEADGRYYIATRFIEGSSLDKVLKAQGKIPWKEALLILEQIASALDYAHRKQIIHRDIKPANIMRGDEEGAVLTDFGLIKALESTGLSSSSGAFLGTPAYIPPEIWMGQEAGPATDQYALACVAGEMLSGQVLFPGGTPPAVMTRHMMTGPELPKTWPGEVSSKLTTVLRRALDKEPQQRYASVVEFVTALKMVGGTNHVVLQVEAESRERSPVNKTPLSEADHNSPVSSNQKPTTVNPSSNNPAGIEWVEIPAGEFLVDEAKQKSYIRKPFWVGKYPVTQAQYQRFIDSNPDYPVPFYDADWARPYNWFEKNRRYPPGKKNHPVVLVSWHDAQAFCRWAYSRLPTEDEWEKAARGTDGRTYPWGEDWLDGKYCNSAEAGIGATTPVDEFPDGASPYGVWDMSGNVWEWTASKFEDGRHYVARGGSWFSESRNVRVVFRYWNLPDTRLNLIGFRCAR